MRITESKIRKIIKEEIHRATSRMNENDQVDEEETETEEERAKRVDFKVQDMAYQFTEGGRVSVKELKVVLDDCFNFALGHEKPEDFSGLKDVYPGWRPADFKKMMQLIYEYLGINPEISENLF